MVTLRAARRAAGDATTVRIALKIDENVENHWFSHAVPSFHALMKPPHAIEDKRMTKMNLFKMKEMEIGKIRWHGKKYNTEG